MAQLEGPSAAQPAAQSAAQSVRPQAHLFDEVETPVRMAELTGDWIYRGRDRAIEEEHDEDVRAVLVRGGAHGPFLGKRVGHLRPDLP